MIDFEKMNEAAAALFDYTDFTSFSKVNTDTKTNNWPYHASSLDGACARRMAF